MTMDRTVELIAKGRSDIALARLQSGDLTEREVKAIQTRASTDPQFRDQYLGSLELLAELEGLAEDVDIQSLVDEAGDSQQAGRWPLLATAAGILIAVVISVVGYLGQHAAVNEKVDILRYVTKVGEQKTVTLEDNSVITLNTGTELLVDFNGDRRRISLARGEVHFDVAKDADRPFTVDLGARSVTALGTRFTIQKLPAHYKLAVMQGVVSLHRTEEAVSTTAPLISAEAEGYISSPVQHRVEAGWAAQFDVDENRVSAWQPDNMERYYSWRSGLIRFYKEPLYKVIQELNRYSAKKILIEDRDVMDLSVYAAVNVRELRAALSGLEQLLPIKVISHFDRIVIVGDDS